MNMLFDSTADLLRREALSSVELVTNSLMDSVNLGVSAVFSNQRALEQVQHEFLLTGITTQRRRVFGC